MVNKMSKIQLVAIIMVSAFFYLFDAPVSGLSAVYGGAISLMNTWLVNRHTNKQNSAANLSPQTTVGMMVASMVMRMGMVAMLILVGVVLLKLSVAALVAGFILGLIGFLADKVLQN